MTVNATKCVDTVTDRSTRTGYARTGQRIQPDSREEETCPDALLWGALCAAPEEGVAVADLVAATGMSQRWVYDRLRTLASDGQAVRTRRGFWHAAHLELTYSDADALSTPCVPTCSYSLSYPWPPAVLRVDR